MSGFLDPRKIIEQLPLEGSISIADLGCGAGSFTIPLAKRVKTGRIYAMDVSEEVLSVLRGRAEMEKVYNIRIMRADVERGLDLNNDTIDLAVAANILFQLEDKENFVKGIHRVLRKGGSLLVVDWLPKVKAGPLHRVSPSATEELLRENGLAFQREIEAGSYHFAYVFRKI